jgi:hypothetical protein
MSTFVINGTNLEYILAEDRCARCKKTFIKTPQWAYWYKNRIACSYHCMRAMERADPNSLLSIRERGGAPKRGVEHVTDEEIEQMTQMRQEGITFYEIAKTLGRSESMVRSTLKRYAVAGPAGGSSRRKYSEDLVKRIRSMYELGVLPRDIAAQMGLPVTTVYYHLDRLRRELHDAGHRRNK